MPSQEEIYEKVSGTLVEALNVDEDEIKPSATLQGDLGAESIDFLDLGCDLEKIVDAEVDFRKLFQAKRAQSEGSGVLDVTVQEVVDYLKTQTEVQEPATVQ
jgi:acyl carrier protein